MEHVEQAEPRRRRGGFLRWQWEAWRRRTTDPRPEMRFETVPHDVAHGSAAAGELRVTWIGHASVLLQTARANLLIDPVWSRRASPVQWAGPARHAAPGVALDELPPLDAILVTHDHYDHLDRLTIERLAGRARPGSQSPVVVSPKGYRNWMRGRGVPAHVELGWADSWELPAEIAGRRADRADRGGVAPAAARITAVPVRHWSRRSLGERNRRLWCGYVAESEGFRTFFCGDSGWCGFAAIGRLSGPFDLVALPIGAYEPRWFMRKAHVNPEESVRAYQALGGSGLCMGIHWGTFVLTDEPSDEPPTRMRRAWADAGLPPERLWIPRHGETRVIAGVIREARSPLDIR